VSSNSTIIYEKLPGDIAQRNVLLLDPILATGAPARRGAPFPTGAGEAGA